MLVCLMGSVLSCLKNSQSINNSSLFWEEFFFFFFFPVHFVPLLVQSFRCTSCVLFIEISQHFKASDACSVPELCAILVVYIKCHCVYQYN